MSTQTKNILAGRMPRRASQVRPLAPTAFEVKEGQFLQITDLHGKQIVDMVAFNKSDTNEYLSTSHTRGINNSLMLIKGMTIYSNRRNPMFMLLEDAVGRHDMLLPACDRQGYIDNYGIEDHPNCVDNFLKVLEPYGISPDRLPDPIHWFMNVGLVARGAFEMREPLSERNDGVILRVLMDMVVAVSACPNDQNASTAFNPTDTLIRVYQ
jgi:uncharacterized protein YcgI (DUF1989 family)